MVNQDPLPPSFDPDKESDKFLIAIKKRASKNFKRTKKDPLENAKHLAYWQYIYGREDEALETCRFLGLSEFEGNFNLWCWVESALALQSRIMRMRGEKKEARQCLKRIKDAGFVEDRLKGRIVGNYRECIKRAIETKDKTLERDWNMLALEELCFIIELSKPGSAAAFEEQFSTHLSRLRQIVKIA